MAMAIRGRFTVRANNLPDVLLNATEKWRALMGQPEATLPWNTEIDITESGADGSDEQYTAVVVVTHHLQEG